MMNAGVRNLSVIERLFYGIQIWAWWTFWIEKDEFSSRLDYRRHPLQRLLYLRELAHVLDQGASVFSDYPIILWKRARKIKKHGGLNVKKRH